MQLLARGIYKPATLLDRHTGRGPTLGNRDRLPQKRGDLLPAFQ